jgi:hypothetical protein
LSTEVVDEVLQVAGDGLQAVKVGLQQVGPEVFVLLDLVPVTQDLISNIKEVQEAVQSGTLVTNLPGVAQRLGSIGTDLVKLQQGLGVLGIAVPVPDLVTQAKNIQRTLLGVWDTGKTVEKDLGATLDALHSACVVLAAHPIPAEPRDGDFTYAAATQVLAEPAAD